ncbi:NAD-dependent succinate-semialdehyde dehydrogenase [Zymomonas mobilis]|uniref:Succinate-semialdehyde dehydrogenase n=1 Tax=Zymomonas mobilis subsp. mobilis (strain ATCC 31821 / ZM4 / CP4) TaxID=264203 RepID=A0A806CIM4_ZYMMO|nr:NAD-dependent succinate-semialdehyde dehydrogenase [Zymomonas mobilis]ADC33837.1 Succinate-semialdehyde dehydrogenase [Zymomonas mobilis subsp. mobilis ZM4 = ATCC 31821]AHB11092.1 succinate semialdehyde dehydrogenase [Zymomonas mobilis subsp. mobilis str. CP4 = NRRL B-14023]AHJ71358.1 Succinate-semialdehyde dehydrogenase [NADP(+)] GabD [Zymomonas mobilis subsp. mobilis NRRL B-12526]AHJ73212.1 Succinate-semialdehyde dehydrogenase [NADP(+)] GabD [Zymomonas mobilis subsp. mobilis str. CP4 = NRR
MKQFIKDKTFINGQWIESSNGQKFLVKNPATGEILAEVPCCGEIETDLAIEGAKKAQKIWEKTTASERSEVILEIYSNILKKKDDLAEILTREQGKPLSEAKGEIEFAASFFKWFAEEARRSYGKTIPSAQKNCRYLTVKKPIGVCAAITPWNFPIGMLARKIAPALAAGCSVIIKPAEQTPLISLAFAQIIDDLKLIPGLVNILTTDNETTPVVGKLLCLSSDIRLISFTGSTDTGKWIYRHSSENIKKLSLELGGNAPFIVFDDADISLAVQGLINSRFRNAGQTCVSANRIFIHKDIHDKFIAELKDKVKKQIKVGNGLDKETTMGPLIDEKAVEKVRNLLDDALAKKAVIELGKEDIRDIKGQFFPPVILSGITPKMDIYHQEIFGPVISIIKFSEENAVVDEANDTKSGLASYIYTNDIKRVSRLSDGLAYGMIGVNYHAISAPEIPFGGVKESGLGREGGDIGLEEYQDIQYICLGI